MSTTLSPTTLSPTIQAATDAVPTSIDLITPVEACRTLDVDADELLGLVNDAVLPAYKLGGFIRFRQTEVCALRQASQLQSSAAARRSPAA